MVAIVLFVLTANLLLHRPLIESLLFSLRSKTPAA
jgi:hypothetical protein